MKTPATYLKTFDPDDIANILTPDLRPADTSTDYLHARSVARPV